MQAYPGDALAVIEEFEPFGDYFIENGQIIATKVSIVNKDKSLKQIYIRGLVSKYVKVGDTILGQVEYVQRPFAHVIIFKVNDEKLHGDLRAMIYINPNFKVVPFNEGAIIRARVIAITAGHLLLDIQDDNMGVLEAWCPYCGGPVVKKGKNMLRCLRCGKSLYMKLAPDFYSTSSKYNRSKIF